MGITHFEAVEREPAMIGHLQGHWSALGRAGGSVTVGVNRIEVAAGGWSTPAHEHGGEEEIFYVLAGRGLAWRDGECAQIGAGDCVVYLPGSGAHTVHALEPLDLLAFGTRREDESPRFPRLGLSLVGGRAVETQPGRHEGIPVQWLREADLGAPELPAQPGPRPATIVNLAEVAPEATTRSRIVRTRRRLSAQAGSRRTGLQHVEVAPGKEATPQHCHSAEEEIFVILSGSGTLMLGSAQTPVRTGHVICRPAGTGVAHVLRAGSEGLSYLAYGTRDPSDICYYPRSNKIAFRGVGIVARLEPLNYWDGEG